MRLAVFFPATLCMLAASGQTVKAPEFDVVSIKLSAPLDPGVMRAYREAGKAPSMNRIMTDTRVNLERIPLTLLVGLAYRVRPEQVAGPEWMKSTDYDVLAELPAGSTKEQIPGMLETMLKDRLGLRAHLRTVEQQVYALVVGAKGLQVKEGVPDGEDFGTPAEERKLREYTMSGMGRYKNDGRGHYEWAAASMSAFADYLSQGNSMTGLPVIDMTGLKGAYQLTMDFQFTTLADVRANAAKAGDGQAADPNPRVDAVFKSIERMGLKLERRKAPMEEVVVDQVEKTPTAN